MENSPNRISLNPINALGIIALLKRRDDFSKR